MSTRLPRTIVLGLFCFLATLPSAILATTPTAVVNDDALTKRFLSELSRLVDSQHAHTNSTLNAEQAAVQLVAAEGKTVHLDRSPTLCPLANKQSLYDAVTPAIVVIGSIYKCDKCNDWHLGTMASGWILSSTGLVVTNHHVLNEAASHHFGVMTALGNVYPVISIQAANKAGDAAVLRIDTRDDQLPSICLGDHPECGDAVTVISHPAGRFYSLSKGVVSRFHCGTLKTEYHSTASPIWLSVTADYILGSSGGPVFNTDGQVIGMVSRTYSTQSSKHNRRYDTLGNQMVFKDCVSLNTLLALIDQTY